MALITPSSASEVDQRSKVDVQRELQTSNPFLRNHWLSAIITALANRIYDFYLSLNITAKEALPDTAVVNLERWAAIWGIIRNPGLAATGRVAIGGVSATSIPNGTNFTSSGGEIYTSTALATVTFQNLTIDSLVSAGTTATLTTVEDHRLASNILISISGAGQPEYNVSGTEIVVTAADELTYTIADNPSSPATGDTFLNFTAASVPVESENFGVDTNQDLDTSLSLQTLLGGVDNAGSVDFGKLGGGIDQETNEEMQPRLLERIQNPIAHFNESEITSLAKTIGGTTRVFVQEITPDVGQVTVYFMRDGDDNPIPDGSEITAMKTLLDTIRPANTSEDDLIVRAPTATGTDYIFTDLQPTTSTMQGAVTESLQQFFAERTTVEENVDADAYRSSIFNTVDVTNGDVVTTFELAHPTGDLVVGSGEIAVLGNVVYP
jgi:uncharacterized phage protein gp47/JayE